MKEINFMDAKFKVRKHGATLVRYNDDKHEYICPESILGVPVVKIGTEAFYQNKFLQSVIIPHSISEIDDYAFASCSSLINITQKGTQNFVDTIRLGEAVFHNCQKIQNINFPRLIEFQFGSDNHFVNCVNLEQLSIIAAEYIGNCSFRNCIKLNTLMLDGEICFNHATFKSASNVDNFYVFGKVVNVEDKEMLDFISNKTLYIHPNSELQELAYNGYAVKIIE